VVPFLKEVREASPQHASLELLYIRRGFMIPGFDVEALNTLGKLISQFERFHLEGAIPEEFDPADLFDEQDQTFFCIRGLANFWEGRVGVDFGQHMIDLVISLGSEKATRTILEGIFPAIILDPISTTALIQRLRPHFLAKGVITGIPSHKSFEHEAQQEQKGSAAGSMTDAREKQEPAQLERVIRGMYGSTWAYIVQAHPRPRNKVVEERMKTIDLLTHVTSRSRVQWQSTKQDNQQITTVESGGRTQTYSGDMVNYRAQYLIKLLERELERIDQASAAGQWLVRTYFGASDNDDARRLASLLLGTLAGSDSRPDPLRSALCETQGKALEAFHTFLTSREVATLIQLPREEVPGYAIHDHTTFDVDFRSSDEMDLPLGYIQQNGRDTHDTFNISLDALAKHAVVIGVTGSGKTTTVMSLLDHMVEMQKPFLVIEPAKTEYRSLHNALGARAHLHVYTLGNEMIAPFRLNPFEFETDDEPGSASLLTHIDFLKAVFNAAFELYTPMPQVLEEALHEVYEDKGWDLTSGSNRRVPNWSERHLYPIFPTLTDLYYKVEVVTDRLHYHSEIESNIKAGLKARIGSLRIGSKGLMLDTARGIPLQQLLSTPTILELESIGSDDEKTFLMGLFLARLYEHRRLQAATGKITGGFQHLIVFEEAHRLLQNTSTQVNNEAANPRAQAIEVFTNMLSEMRAYGQGVLVAEQIPSKLAPDVLKNTNLKIVHRLIAQDDRQSIGQTMNLNSDQQTHLGILTPGMAAIYAEGADHAYLVRLENYKRKIKPLVDAELKQISREYVSVKPFQSIIDIGEYDVPCTPLGGPDPAAYHAAGKLLDSAKSKWLWANIMLRLVSSPGNFFEMVTRFSEHIEAEMPYLPSEQHDIYLRMVILRGSAQILQERGAQFGWTYAQVEQLRTSLTHGLLGFFHAYRTTLQESHLKKGELEHQAQQELDIASDYLAQFTASYATLMERKQGPFVGCTYCLEKCLYRLEVNTLLSEKDQEAVIGELINEAETTLTEHYDAVASAATQITQKWLDAEEGSDLDSTSSISYCIALHTLAKAGFSEYEQDVVSDGLKQSILS
jgi:GTPase SAR1 family protein